jgi:nucleoside-diphosphate-sugar epimerase
VSLGRIIITGANGFIGCNLIKSAADISDEIIAIDSFEYIKEDYVSGLRKEFSNLDLIVGDVSQKDVWEKLQNKKIDYIFHFGTPSSIVLFNKNPERCMYQTIFSTFFVFKYGIKMGVSKIVFPSSGNVYGGNFSKDPLSEEIQPLARNLYASSKLACGK